MFNITNRTNFARVNNVVGAAFGPPFSAHGTASLSPSQPLGFTGALPKREIQLGIRFDFSAGWRADEGFSKTFDSSTKPSGRELNPILHEGSGTSTQRVLRRLRGASKT